MAKFKRYRAPLVEDEEHKSNGGSGVENSARPIGNRGITTSHGKGFDAAAKKATEGAGKKEGKRTFARPQKNESTQQATSNSPKSAPKANTPPPKQSGVQKSVQTGNFTTANSSGHRAIVKTNYCRGEKAQSLVREASGYGNNHGRKDSGKAKIYSNSKAQDSADYYNRERAQSEIQRDAKKEQELERGEKLSNTYDRDGNRLTQSEYNAYRDELKDIKIEGMRRTMISPEPSDNLSEQEMIAVTRDVMHMWQEESGKGFDFTFAIHDGQSHIHSHVIMYSENAVDVYMGKRQLEHFKCLVDQAVTQVVEARLENAEELDLDYEKDLVYGLNEELVVALEDQTQENNLSL